MQLVSSVLTVLILVIATRMRCEDMVPRPSLPGYALEREASASLVNFSSALQAVLAAGQVLALYWQGGGGGGGSQGCQDTRYTVFKFPTNPPHRAIVYLQVWREWDLRSTAL